MKTKSINRVNKKNKTYKNNKKNKILKKKAKSILYEKKQPLESIISETKNKKINNIENNKLLKYFHTPYNKNSIYLIKNDFFTFINEIWLNKLILDKEQLRYLVKIDDFRILQYQVYNKLNDIILNYINTNNSNISFELKNYYESAYKFNTVNSSRIFIKKMISQIDKIREDKNNLWKMLAFINKNELTNQMGPFSWEYNIDAKDTNKYINYIYPHKFAIFDISVYSDDNYDTEQRNTYANKYKIFFKKYLDDLFKTTLPNDKALNSDDVFDVAKVFFELFGKIDPNVIENEEMYYKIASEEAMKKYGFNWVQYCIELGYQEDNIPDFFVTNNINYFIFCTKILLDEWNSEKWRSYWIWLILRYVVRFTAEWHHIFYKFYGEETKGMLESYRKTTTHSAVLMSIYAFNPIYNNEYIRYSYNEDYMFYAKKLAYNLRDIFVNKISRNTWMSEKTRKYSIEKLQNIEINIGHKEMPVNNKYLPLLNYNPDEFLENMIKVIEWRHNLYLTNQVDVIDTLAKIDWDSYPAQITNLPSYIVNAQYSPIRNSINISNAYLQKPFINLDEHGIEYNLAYIGFTIAHELGHSLDDFGSKFDMEGNYYDWWTKKDRQHFTKIQNEIINQYEVFAQYEKLNYDASQTIGEDIADISGLNICEEYLRDYCIQNKFTPHITYLTYREFYVYFAYQMRQKIHKQSVLFELITNPHPIDKYRTNVTLSRSPFFRTIYDLKKGDHMYWDNKTGIWD